MLYRTIAIALAAGAATLAPITAQAFECPRHFADAQAQIDKVMADMEGMEGMSMEDVALVHALLDDARMLLEAAKHNHEKPQGPYDHGRSIARADSARGNALGAELLHFQFMQQM